MSKLKIVSIVGARPQFIKYGPLGRKLKAEFDEILIHTGQHYDKNMSDLFFKDLNIPQPDINLGIGSYTHGKQTALMIEAIEKILLKIKPDLVIVFGDTNSTLAGALAASKLHIKVVHIEAGLRSYNKNMPEEINRVLTDHCSDLLFCPTKTAVLNLKLENIKTGVYFAGDIMYEAFRENLKIAENRSIILKKENLNPHEYYLVTIHRAENTDNKYNLLNIIKALNLIDNNIIFPVHPRTLKTLRSIDIKINSKIKLIEPVGYLDMLILIKNAKKILTDSGGIQKEAYFANKYCKTLRNETEWVETLEKNKNVLCGTDIKKIVFEALKKEEDFKNNSNNIFGNGNTSDFIIRILKNVQK